MPLITIFTPTYNRGKLLPQLYRSLANQNNNDFEWLIVDDGSIDNTREIVNEFINTAPFSIRYFRKDNGGVNSAWNLGVERAKGVFFARVDSDDYLKPRAINKICEYCLLISSRPDYDSVITLTEDVNGQIIGNKYPSEFFESDNITNFFKLKIHGEKFIISKLDILKKYPFPQFASEKFVPESYLWFQLGLMYKQLYINNSIKVYDNSGADSITSNIKQTKIKNCIGYYHYYKLVVSIKSIPLFTRFLYSVLMSKMYFHSKRSAPLVTNFLTILAMPCGFILYCTDKTR